MDCQSASLPVCQSASLPVCQWFSKWSLLYVSGSTKQLWRLSRYMSYSIFTLEDSHCKSCHGDCLVLISCRLVLFLPWNWCLISTFPSISLDWINYKIISVLALHYIGLVKIPVIEFLPLNWIYSSVHKPPAKRSYPAASFSLSQIRISSLLSTNLCLRSYRISSSLPALTWASSLSSSSSLALHTQMRQC